MSKMGDFYIWMEETYPEVTFLGDDGDHIQSYLDEYLESLKEPEPPEVHLIASPGPMHSHVSKHINCGQLEIGKDYTFVLREDL